MDGDIDIDIIVDDQSPVLQNIEIRRLRLINVLDKVLSKIEIAYAIEDLTKDNGLLIAPYLSEKDLRTVLTNNEERYAVPSHSMYAVHSSKSISKSLTHKSKSKKNMILSAMESHQSILTSTLIQILLSSTQIRNLAKNIVSQMPENKKEFLQYMIEFRDIAVKKFYTTATDERNFNKKIATTWDQNEKLKVKNLEMEKIRDAKLADLTLKLNDKYDVIAAQKQSIIDMNTLCIQELQKIINKSEYMMTKATLTSTERQEILSVEAKSITNQYHLQLERDLAEEKVLRTKRYKLETVLSNWLNTYDVDIGELQSQLEELTDGYEAEKAELEELQRNFDNQEIQYVELMAEKEEEERLIFEKKCYEFIQFRSCRRIQRWWRAILGRRKSRRKGRKGKGKGKGKKK